ncbi:putative cobalamin synthesis protein [Longimycelium tulufanense]|uniref:Putative cobalamin synthesis protein n=1 Tax=Longimycelium tulufanense TaxID=907463 RepID=A0A8J3CKG2_9PSEU|nr:putative cobalamin synthesis protein [Longimycelium tulufanense]
MADDRTPVVLVAGLATAAVTRVAEEFLRRPGTAVVHHDLREITHGVVRRRMRWGGQDQRAVLELAHGCVSCTLRQDLLPLLLRLCHTPGVDRVVLHLDPAMEPEAICWALRHVVVEGKTVVERARVDGVVTVLDQATWLADATGDEPLAERDLQASADDERTVAQVAVGQVEFADALVIGGVRPESWTAERTRAVLDRLAPGAPRARLDLLDAEALLAKVPPNARRGEVDDAHAPLLRGQPPLESDCGVRVVHFSQRRPFHPERLHDALDVLLEGVVRARGRAWVASQPDVTLWLESAGGGLRVGHAGPWLAALDPAYWDRVGAERRAMAALRWDPYYGDRDQEVVVIAHRADPEEITRALERALLTDEELGAGESIWRSYPDPFGHWHAEPCSDNETAEADRGGNRLRNNKEDK